MTYAGLGCSQGYGEGNARIIREVPLDYSKVVFTSVSDEKKRLNSAIEAFCANTEKLVNSLRAKTSSGGECDILSGHMAMIKDPFMLGQMENFIENGHTAESALATVCGIYIDMFSAAEDDLTRQRANDIIDIKSRILKIMLGVKEEELENLPPGTVIVAHNFTPSMTSRINHENIAGIVAEKGGLTSHSAILARAFNIPAVLGVEGITSKIKSGDYVIVDGTNGEVHVNPNREQKHKFFRLKNRAIEAQREINAYRGKETKTADGIKINLYGNIGKPSETKALIENDAEGVGLVRTEFLFMDRFNIPTEEEQYRAYAQVIDAVGRDKEVVIRTLDIGGDKDIAYLNLKKEGNSYLGLRAIRYCLDKKDIFSIQLRAIMRAAKKGKIKILLPFVSDVEEIRETKKLIKSLSEEMSKERVHFSDNIRIGTMIETPAAVISADLLAKEVDFFSIGTNDLTQYTNAVDRGNPKVKNYYRVASPAVLRSIKRVIDVALENGIPVGMCGEAASDPMLIPVFLSFGLREFSVSPYNILSTRKIISAWDKKRADEITKEVMTMSCASEIEAFLKKKTDRVYGISN